MRLRTRLLGVTAGCLGMVAATVLSAAPAQATVCTGLNCGKVKNKSTAGMHFTVDLGSGGDRCDVWNYDGGNKEKWKYAKCGQTFLGAGKSKGGAGSGVDVDAFTFNGTSYGLRMYSDTAPVQTRKKGIWTKIRGDEVATCKQKYGRPECVVIDTSPL
ncbi:hypothetical protein ACIBKX_15780 [Streptomyces sp. NPDC050658]|uniref:hypothetical protein n=1 Tax=unclassified Streptomyces TaxID=2593676 RepID=UPI003445FB36